jgi:dihydrofolate reductase
MTGREGVLTNIDDGWARRSMEGFGAFIIGRNMFGPSRGPWPDDSWKGWWGEDPPFHAPTFVLTHHQRDSLVMDGGTVFHFVTGGIHEALSAARDTAGDKDVKIGGGASVVRQYLEAGLVDSLHLAFSPTVLGGGEAPLAGIDLPSLGFFVTDHTGAENAMHIVLERHKTHLTHRNDKSDG